MSKILVVEDDIDLCSLVADALSMDYEVDTANDGKEAQSRLSTGDYDLIIMDWDLPHVTGVDVCRGYRQMGGLAPVLMLTGRQGTNHKEQGFDAGADDYMTKPFDVREFLARVKAMLRRSATNRLVAQKQVEKIISSPGLVCLGDLVGEKYRLEEFLGEGGMAAVYRANHMVMNKPVVVKLLHAHLLRDETSMGRFHTEYQLLAKINHPNIIGIYDVGYTNSRQPYLVMEFVKGQSLRRVLDAGKQLALSTCTRVMMQLCAGLHEAHLAGVVHRDIKPENIMLQDRSDRHDWVKLLDFGIAHMANTGHRLTQEGCVVGTAEYIAPEHLLDDAIPVDIRTDVYGLGIIFYELLTGAVPFTASTVEAIFNKQLSEAPIPPSRKRPDLPAAVDGIVLKALEKDPRMRYQSAQAMRTALETLLTPKT